MNSFQVYNHSSTLIWTWVTIAKEYLGLVSLARVMGQVLLDNLESVRVCRQVRSGMSLEDGL